MMKNDEHMLYEYTEALVKDVDQFSKYYIMGLDYGAFRVTLINADGSVFYDSKAKAHSMPNHKDRSEFIEAMKNGSSSVERFSETLDTETVYYAVKLKSGEILRAYI